MKAPHHALRALALLLIAVTLSCAPDDRRTPPFEPQFTHTSEGATAPSPDMYRIDDRLPLDLTALQVSQLIGISGGSVHLAGHSITVPAGAVKLPTVFTLTLAANGYVEVELKALRTSLLGLINIGQKGFDKAVPLTLTYARSTNVTDVDRLRIMRLKSNGKHEILPSTVSSGPKTVTAELWHFSRYAMVSD